MEKTILEKYQEFNPHNNTNTKSENIVFSILNNLEGRSGIGNALESIDDEIFEDMLNTLYLIAQKIINQ